MQFAGPFAYKNSSELLALVDALIHIKLKTHIYLTMHGFIVVTLMFLSDLAGGLSDAV